MIDMYKRFSIFEEWEYDKNYMDGIYARDKTNDSFMELNLSDETPEGRENIRLVLAAPTMYKFLAKLLQDEDFLRNPVQIALTAQKILMRIEGELNEVEK